MSLFQAAPTQKTGRALVATNHLADLAGSEVIALEMAEHLLGKGFSVSVFANFSGGRMADLFQAKLDLKIENDPAAVKPFQFDFCYFQHHVAPLFDYQPMPGDRDRTTIAFGRLARRTFFESGGWWHDNALGDVTIANSELTAEKLAVTGVGHRVETFYNAAPQIFFAAPRALPGRPQNILVVTNHRDADLMSAIDLLRTDSVLRHIGRSGDEIRLVTPDLIQAADLVISIGKTVPYALAARIPVYVYDHFGGPGYLTSDNFNRAARFNFTGRRCERRLKGDDIRQDILEGYLGAVAFAHNLNAGLLERYRFEKYVDGLLGIGPRPTEDKRHALHSEAGRVELERLMAHHVRGDYIGLRR
jgi:hypothetical protein